MDNNTSLPKYLHNSHFWNQVREINNREPTYADFAIDAFKQTGTFKDNDTINDVADFSCVMKTCHLFGTTDYPNSLYGYAYNNQKEVLAWIHENMATISFGDNEKLRQLYVDLLYPFSVCYQIVAIPCYKNSVTTFQYDMHVIFKKHNVKCSKYFTIDDSGRLRWNDSNPRFVRYSHVPACKIFGDFVHAIFSNNPHSFDFMSYENDRKMLKIINAETNSKYLDDGIIKFALSKLDRYHVIDIFKQISSSIEKLAFTQINGKNHDAYNITKLHHLNRCMIRFTPTENNLLYVAGNMQFIPHSVNVAGMLSNIINAIETNNSELAKDIIDSFRTLHRELHDVVFPSSL